MAELEEPENAPVPTERERWERAEAVLRTGQDGGDLSAETLRLSNEFTDEWTARIRARLLKLLRRPGS